jgi:cytoskeletal protein RodZ
MSLTLGEKLRQAREERGITLSEVAEHTRISSLYLESIENDDYRNLPGGIFNKGFVKSFAKYVGINEQEALADYAQIIADAEGTADPELKIYKPEVLTDDRTGSSMAPTVIVAVILLAILTAGTLFLVRYLRQPSTVTQSNTANSQNANAANTTAQEVTPQSGAPQMGAIKVEFKVTSDKISLTAINDGTKTNPGVTPATPATFEPKESLKLSFYGPLAQLAQLVINGKIIELPKTPNKGKLMEFEINKDDLAQIWQSGSITGETPSANTAVTTGTPSTTTPVKTSTPKPANTSTNTPSPTPKPATPKPTPKPSAKPAANPPEV